MPFFPAVPIVLSGKKLSSLQTLCFIEGFEGL